MSEQKRIKLPDWLDLIAFLRKYSGALQYLGQILPLPDWTDREKVHTWAIKVMPVLETAVDWTDTEIDDTAVEIFKLIVADPELFAVFYGLFIVDDAGSVACMATVGDPTTVQLADKAGVSPVMIMLIFQAVMKLIEWWKNR